jgi:hypothetical protein
MKGRTGMKKPSSRIREEISKLQEQLRLAETREAERIGRIALKAGFGEIEVEEAELEAAFEELTRRFRKGKTSGGSEQARRSEAGPVQTAPVAPGATTGWSAED